MKCRFPVQIMCKGRQIYVPCGHCAWCLRRLRDEWYVRLKYEGSKALFRSFVTYTYRDNDLPLKIDEDSGLMVPSVSLEDVQKFHKRIRKKVKFRFMLCSEYGPKTGRPHYHGVYFHNEPFNFAKAWPFGDNNVQMPAKDGSYKYILKYLLKGSNVPDGADPNFKTMSRRPGLGDGMVYNPDNHFILLENGIKSFVPRYFKKRYLSRLDDQLRNCYSEMALDYLALKEQHAEFHQEYDRLVKNGSLDSNFTSFEDWLYALYGNDFKKQVSINKRQKDVDI